MDYNIILVHPVLVCNSNYNNSVVNVFLLQLQIKTQPIFTKTFNSIQSLALTSIIYFLNKI